MDMLDQYDYELPEGLIANEPAEPRDSARLLVYRSATDEVELMQVKDLPQLLPNTHFVINDTRVLPARLKAHGEGGKPVELLVLVDQGFGADATVRVLVNRFTPVGECVAVGDAQFEVLENTEKAMVMRFSGDQQELEELLHEAGETPLPPYIDREAGSEAARRMQYQTIFAANDPSVAAPTASLHFTPALIENLTGAGVQFSPVTLQVGLGTFAPIFEENFASGKLHREFFSVPEESARAIKHAKETGIPVVAVGTTVVRTLESAKDSILAGEGVVDSTEIFIYPPYQFTVPDCMMTNFHVPRSSLMCLVDAYLKDKGAKRSLMELYSIAVQEKFRFYSFGDAMLII